MKKIVIILTLLFSSLSFASVSGQQEVSCSQYGSNANSCDQCFDGGSKYTGDVFRPYDVFNAGSKDRIYYYDENPSNYSVSTLGSSTNWYVSNNLLQYPSNLSWQTASSGRSYLHFRANTSTRFLETQSGKGIRLQSVSGTPSPYQPALRFTFTVKARTLISQGNVGPIVTHRECVFYKPNYCGDGIRQGNKGEVCDPNDSSQSGWGSGGCNNSCQPIEAAPVCNSLSVNKTSGEAPTNVSATCSGFKVNNWKIDCGNGQVFTGNGNNSGNQTFTRTCNYNSAGTYTPRCTINNTITNNSCKKTVNITESINPSIVVDKRDQNISDLDGNVGNDTQTVYVGEASRFLITVTNNGPEALRNVSLNDPMEPSCNRSTSQTQSLISSVGNGNMFLDPGESFSYTCSKSNTQSNYINTIGVNATGVTSGKNTGDSDPTVIIVVPNQTPQISVDKRDANNNDLDGSVGGNDSQTVNLGDEAVFRIRVENTGTEDLRNVTLIDAVAPACASNGVVNLANKSFTNQDGNNVSLSVSGVGNHNDAIFQVGEVFVYTCEKANTQGAYTNVVEVSGVGVTSGTTVGDNDPTEVIIGNTPDIQVIKQDANSNDIDGIQFNDTQTVTRGSEAVFHITVKNTGAEDLGDIRLTDAMAASCASNGIVNLSGSNFTNQDGVVVDIFFGGTGNHSDDVFQVGEEFTYTCSKGDTQANYINVVEVSGVGITSGTTVGDDDPTVIIIEDGVYDLALRKVLSSTTPGPFTSGEDVRFDIEIYNQGNIDSGEIEITDYVPAQLAFVSGNGWTISGNTLTQTVANIPAGGSTILSVDFTISSNATGSIENFAEISSDNGDDCDSTPDSTNGNGAGESTGLVDNDIGTGCNPGGDEDDHDIEVITIQVPAYDLALRKVVSSSTPGPFSTGNEVSFTITVFNQGTFDSGSIEITDYIPTGLTLSDSAWTQSGSSATRTISNIAPGGSTPVNITFTIDQNAPTNIDNFAEISSDNGDDCDSTPDSTNGNGSGESTGLVDDSTGTACEPGGDEDDHDIASITIGGVSTPTCNNLTASPSSARDVLTSTLSCTGTAATSFRIEVKDEAGNIVETINGASGSVTLSRGNASTANFTAQCFINDTITSNSCQQALSVTSGTSSSGGGSPARCTDIIDNPGDSYTCWGNNRTQSIAMKCGNDPDTGEDIYLSPKTGSQITREVSGARTAEFTCSDPFPRCYVKKAVDSTFSVSEIGSSGSNSWITEDRCQIQTNPICGDGIINQASEVCDLGVNNGKAGFACTSSCNIPSSSSGGGSSSSGGGGGCDPLREICSITTTPTGGEIIFGPFGGHVVGHNKNVLEDIPAWPFIENTSEYDYSFAELCIKKTSGDDSVFGPSNEICTDLSNKMLYGYEKLYIAKEKSSGTYKAVSQYELTDNASQYEYPDFVSNKDAIPSGRDYGETTLTTSIKDDIDRNGSIDNLYNAYFAAKLDVRVAKPSIATIGGGTSFIKDGSATTGDIRKITDGMSDFDQNDNFVGVAVTDNGISSSAESTTDSDVIQDNETQNDDFKQDVDDVTDTAVIVTPTGPAKDFADFENFNGLENVFIIKGSNVELGTLSGFAPGISKPTTFIIEGGNLTFTQDIVTNENIAFVVKGGDILIKKNVEQLSGTYISITENAVGGNIISESSSEQLIVYGSLLGNLEDLVSNRYYIENSGGQLSVGTIVSFGSRLLSKPAPLVAQFKSEYNASQKIAR